MPRAAKKYNNKLPSEWQFSQKRYGKHKILCIYPLSVCQPFGGKVKKPRNSEA